MSTSTYLSTAAVLEFPTGEPLAPQPNGKAWHAPIVTEVTGAEADEFRRAYAAEEARQAQAAPAGIGHNDPAAYKAHLVEQIRDWVANRRQREADYMRPEEIGAAENRPFLLLRALVDGAAHIQRSGIGDGDERGASYVAAVYIADTVFSDNSNGCSTVSATRTGALLGCSEKTVRRARDILVENRVLGRRKHGGIEDQHWPIISRTLAREATNVFWWLDATSEPTKRGRPPHKTPDPMRSGLSEKNPGPDAVQGLEKPRTQIVKTPDRMRSDELTIELTRREDPLAVAAAHATLFPGEVLPEETLPPTKGSLCKPSAATPKGRRKILGSGGATEEQWLRFWPAYPTKAGKFEAHRNFLELTHAEAELAIFGAGQYAAEIAAKREEARRRGREEPTPKHAQGWLTARRFEDYDQAYVAASAGPLDPEDEVKQYVASPDGQSVIREHGHEKGLRIIREIVLGNAKDGGRS